MPVSLGVKPDHGFDEPLGLLSDCHRRIENFLGMMIRVLERTQVGQRALAPDERAAMEAALRYFDVAAPRHTQDEERSLFPRLRQSSDPAAHAALAQVESLEADHRQTDDMHAQVKHLCRRWLDDQPLVAEDFHQIQHLLHQLREIYTRHISVEDNELFPTAARVLNPRQLAEIGQEMAQRRNLSVK